MWTMWRSYDYYSTMKDTKLDSKLRVLYSDRYYIKNLNANGCQHFILKFSDGRQYSPKSKMTIYLMNITEISVNVKVSIFLHRGEVCSRSYIQSEADCRRCSWRCYYRNTYNSTTTYSYSLISYYTSCSCYYSSLDGGLTKLLIFVFRTSNFPGS